MGGVDLYGKLLGSYRPTIASKKWYFNLIVNSFNTAVVASFKLYEALHCSGRATNSKSAPYADHLTFRKDLIEDLAVFGSRERKKAIDLNKKVPIVTSHVLERKENGKRSKCVHCKRYTYFNCKGCAKTCCPDCLATSHNMI